MSNEALQYPVGRFDPPAAWDGSAIEGWIGDVERLPAAVRAAVGGLDRAALDTPYRPGGWTVRQLVHHILDSHVNAWCRFQLALTEDVPTIKPYDQDAWVALSYVRTMPVEPSLQALDGVHARWGAVLRAMPLGDFDREFIHPEHEGRFTLGRTLAMYAWHGRHHVAHINGIRERSGW